MFTNKETNRCQLRYFREADLNAFTAYRSEPEVARFQSWESYSHEEAVALYKDVKGKAFGLIGQWYQIAIADKATDELIGDLALHFVEPKLLEIGFTISPRYQGKGYGKEAVQGLLAHLFKELDFEKVVATTDAKNIASIKLLEALGFEREVDARSVIFKGEPGEEFDYFCLREVWLLRNSA